MKYSQINSFQRSQKSLKKFESMLTLLLVALLIVFINSAAFQIAGPQFAPNQRISLNSIQNLGNTFNSNQNALSLDAAPKQIIDTRPPISTPSQKQIYQYKGQITINVNENQPQNIIFQAAFVQDEEPCNYKKCFLGWISEFKINNQETIQGYPKASGQQPIFKFATNNDDDNKITYSNDLDETWKQLIQISCQKFNPLLESKAKKYTFSQTSQNQNNFALSGARIAFNSQPTIKTATLDNNNYKIPNLNAQQARHTQNIKILNQNDFISQRSHSLDIKLTSKFQSQSNGPAPNLNGKITINFDLLKRSRDSSSIIQSIKSQFNQRAIRYTTFSKDDIEKNRASSLNSRNIKINSDFKQKDNEPKIQLINSRTIPGQTIDNLDIQKQFQKAQIQGINYKGDGTQQQNLNTNQFQTLSLNNIKGRSLQSPIVNILTQTKTLFLAQIFNKKVSLQVQVKCDLQLTSQTQYQTIYCVANVIYDFFGNVKTIKVYQFKKSTSNFWDWNKNYSGDWSFYISIPFPPPFSMITANFYVSVNYYLNINLFSKKISQIPYLWRLGGLVQTEVNTDSRVSLKVFPIQGGVYLRGTLIKGGTDPSMTFRYMFSQKKIQVIFQWYAWITAFQLQWGLFYRKYKPFVGWGSIKPISTWYINSIYSKWQIYYNSLIFSY